MPLEYTFARLEGFGVFDALLPFILIFVIVFAVLQKIKIFGDGPKVKSYNTVIALVMGAAVIYPHIMGYYPPDRDIVNIINQALPNISVVIVAIVMGLILIGVMGKRFELGGNSLSGWIAILSFAVVIYVFGAAANWWSVPSFLYWITADPDLTSLVIVILVFAILIWWITKEDKKDGKKSFSEQFGELLQSPDGKK